MQYLTSYRLQTARDLLQNTDRQVSDICFATGFSDLPHFVRVFGKTFGMPPARYRKQLAEAGEQESGPKGSPADRTKACPK
ncbi:MAG TPA: helix-turn-helix transcriptional regulator [Candidatus Desulfovibrio intestinipullorum]|uniref:Helix-turn-helix transcriptional regulator n=1 Tax=Candidatus Desulfovibrio intestinipullorum TaxID=2838536 RepID=A0A9D1PW70_9BACT|nr:helix-turn-helix transcriptional regulator [Candidatus Desulfovibrio intestinipullorum]